MDSEACVEFTGFVRVYNLFSAVKCWFLRLVYDLFAGCGWFRTLLWWFSGVCRLLGVGMIWSFGLGSFKEQVCI